MSGLSVSGCHPGIFPGEDGEIHRDVPLDGDVNPDTTTFGFPAYLGLSEQVQSSNGSYLQHGWRFVVVVDVREDTSHRAMFLFAQVMQKTSNPTSNLERVT